MLLIFKCGNTWKTKKANICEPTGDPKKPFTISYKTSAENELQIKDPKAFKAFFQEFKNEERREVLKNQEMANVEMAEKFIEEQNITRSILYIII